MKFPEKLWCIVNNCKSGAIGWTSSGDSIFLIYETFKQEFLCEENAAFKTKNINSFVRQLNLYGFKKCNRVNEEQHEFKHQFFIRTRKDLLSKIHRKPGSFHGIDSPIKKLPDPKFNSLLSVSKNKVKRHDESNSFCFEHANSTARMCKPLSLDQSSDSDKDNTINSSLGDSLPVSVPYHSYMQNGWLPADAEFYNSQKFKSGFSGEVHSKDSNRCNHSHDNDYVPYSLDISPNAYIFVVPGYAFQHPPFSNQDVLNSLMHFMVYPSVGLRPEVQNQ